MKKIKGYGRGGVDLTASISWPVVGTGNGKRVERKKIGLHPSYFVPLTL